jgi:hypothetical protein
MSVRRSIVTGVAVLGMAIGGLLLGGAPAFASFIYGPVAPTVFGSAGSGDGEFSEPTGVAVNQATGDVYVLDQGNLRVEEFSAAGHYLAQFNGSEDPNFPEGFSSPTGIAVDNSSGPSAGDVYVADAGHDVVEKFSATGAYIGQLTGTPQGPFNEPYGGSLHVAVDAAGNLWVFEQGQKQNLVGPVPEGVVDEFDGSLGNAPLQRWGTGGTQGTDLIAVDSNDDVYVYDRLRLEDERPEVIEKFTGAGEDLGTVNRCECATGLAVDQANHLFLDEAGTVNVYTPGGGAEYGQKFGEGYLASGAGLAVNDTTGDVYVADAAADQVDVFPPVASVLAPKVNDVAPTASVTRTTALVNGTIDPGGLATSYWVEYVDAGEYEPGAANPFVNAASSATGSLTAAEADDGVGPMVIEGLLAGTTYHYRVVASNGVGATYGPDYTFTTATATPPGVTTDPAIELTSTTATLTGVVEAQALQTSYEFEFGSSTSYGGKQFGNAGRSGGQEPVSVVLQFLVPGVTYHFRLVATNEDGTTYGQDVAFTTPGVPAPISQPPVEAMIPSPVVTFPSVAGAITKPRGSTKSKKKKRKAKSRKRRRGKR